MKKGTILLFLFLAMFMGKVSPVLADTADDYFTLVVFSDPHIGQEGHDGTSVSDMQKYATNIVNMGTDGGKQFTFTNAPSGFVPKADIVICLGDMDGDSEKSGSNFKSAVSPLTNADIPFLVVCGNHDLVPDYWSGGDEGLTWSGQSCNSTALGIATSFYTAAQSKTNPITDCSRISDGTSHTQTQPMAFMFGGVRFYLAQTYWFQKPYSGSTVYRPDEVIDALQTYLNSHQNEPAIWLQHYPFVAGSDCDYWWTDINSNGLVKVPSPNTTYGTYEVDDIASTAQIRKNKMLDLIKQTNCSVHFSGHTHSYGVNTYTSTSDNTKSITDYTVAAPGVTEGAAYIVLVKKNVGVVEVKQASFQDDTATDIKSNTPLKFKHVKSGKYISTTTTSVSGSSFSANALTLQDEGSVFYFSDYDSTNDRYAVRTGKNSGNYLAYKGLGSDNVTWYRAVILDSSPSYWKPYTGTADGQYYMYSNGGGAYMSTDGSTSAGSALYAVQSSQSDGDQFVIEYLPKTTYNVVVSPADLEGAGITLSSDLGGGSRGNGGSFQSYDDPVLGTDYTINDVDGYAGSASLSGTTLTIIYEIDRYAKTVSDIEEGWYWIESGTSNNVQGRIMQGQSTTLLRSNSSYYMTMVEKASSDNTAFIYVTNNNGTATFRTTDGYYMKASGERDASSQDITLYSDASGQFRISGTISSKTQYAQAFNFGTSDAPSYGVGSTSSNSAPRWKFASVDDKVEEAYDVYTVEWEGTTGTLSHSSRVIFNNKVVLQTKGTALTNDGFTASEETGYPTPTISIDTDLKKITVTYEVPTTNYSVSVTPNNIGGGITLTSDTKDVKTVYGDGINFDFQSMSAPVRDTDFATVNVEGYSVTSVTVADAQISVVYTQNTGSNVYYTVHVTPDNIGGGIKLLTGDEAGTTKGNSETFEFSADAAPVLGTDFTAVDVDCYVTGTPEIDNTNHTVSITYTAATPATYEATLKTRAEILAMNNDDEIVIVFGNACTEGYFLGYNGSRLSSTWGTQGSGVSSIQGNQNYWWYLKKTSSGYTLRSYASPTIYLAGSSTSGTAASFSTSVSYWSIPNSNTLATDSKWSYHNADNLVRFSVGSMFLNSQGNVNNLKMLNGQGSWSAWEVYQIDIDTWTVTTNPTDKGGITVGSTSVGNGSSFSFPAGKTPVKGTDFTTKVVNGYKSTTTIDATNKNIFVAYEESVDPTTYTVVVTGAFTDQGGITLLTGTYAGETRGNSQTFDFVGVPELDTNYSVVSVAGYRNHHAISGTTITITYYTDVQVGGRYYIKGYRDNGNGPRYIYANSSTTMATTTTKPTDGSDVWVVEDYSAANNQYKLKNELNGTYMTYEATLSSTANVIYVKDDKTIAAGFIGKYEITAYNGSKYRSMVAGASEVGFSTKNTLDDAYPAYAGNADYWRNMEFEAASPLEEITYTVVVTGAPDGSTSGITLVDGNTHKAHGETFTFTGTPQETTNYTVDAISGYTYTVTITDGSYDTHKNLNVAYKKNLPDFTALNTAIAKAAQYENLIKDGLGYYHETFDSGTFATYLAQARAIDQTDNSNATQTEVDNAATQLNTILTYGIAINLPQPGTFLRMKGTGNLYLADGLSNSHYSTSSTADDHTLFYYTAGNKLRAVGTGKYNTANYYTTSFTWADDEADGVTVTFKQGTGQIGKYAIETSTDNLPGKFVIQAYNQDRVYVVASNATTEYPNSWTLEAVEAATFDLKIAASGLSSLCLPYSATLPDNTYAYAATDYHVTKGLVTLSLVNSRYIEANKGYIIKGERDEQPTVQFVQSMETTNDPATNYLVGVTDAKSMEDMESCYMMLGGNFCLITGGTLAANKAYLDLSSFGANAEVKGFTMDDETGVVSLSTLSGQQSTAVYNLAGQKVNAGYRGIVIVNGKKVLR